ncbi:MAG: class I SAM-dependent DNA methyltransferase, partial [Alphaproteobacteria bacterium]|nr:class I SAM-dependent DNA methyltransferase [Alphaproteobacteria bacterium]
MNAADFIRKWGDSTLRERQASQSHFNDLCALIGEKTPTEADPFGESYCFERGAEKTGGGDGWADVWKKGCFAWEYKGKHKDLKGALRQVQAYALDLQNPPFLVVSDMERIEVHTNWTNTVSKTHVLTLEDLREPAKLELLRQVFAGSDALKPGVSPQELTATVAERFGDLGKRLQERGHAPRAVAHFLNQLVFCMFAEDAGLLPDALFSRTIKATQTRPGVAQAQLADLFAKMATEAEDERFFGPELIRWFNGGLFDRAETLPLTVQDLKLIGDTAADNDWSEIDPAIFGTLFEQALTATRERPALGAHYTDREKILKIVDPVIIRPRPAEREAALAVVKAHAEAMKAAEAERAALTEAAAEQFRSDPKAAKAGEGKRQKALNAIAKRRDAAYGAAQDALNAFLDRLAAFRVLDPACGSGNFLYVALQALKDIELRAIVEAERMGIAAPAPRVGLDAVKGIEIEAYAAELARVTLWIGDLQWMKRNGYTNYREPILNTLDQIECRDALMTRVEPSAPSGGEAGAAGGSPAEGREGGKTETVAKAPLPSSGHLPPNRAPKGALGEGGERWIEAQWPEADAIIGNPPFLGGKRMRDGLGDAYVERLFALFKGRVPAEADFVVYWVEKGWEAIKAGRARRVGLVATNSVRGGANRKVLETIADAEALQEAWADEPWILQGAAVRVSMLGYGEGFVGRQLDGRAVATINADLTSA